MAQQAVEQYYAGGSEDLLSVVLQALRDAGRPTDPLDPDDLALLDEFHGMGRAATVALADLAEISSGESVLDLGAGIGGPARTLARHYGAKVTALDPTARFCALNEELCRRSGLEGSVEVVRGDGRRLPFGDASFDAIITQAVWPSIEDKPAMLAEARRVLKPSGRLAIFEAVTGPGDGELRYPVPWADGPEQSFVVSAQLAQQLAGEAGFTTETWLEGVAAIELVGKAAASGQQSMSIGTEGVDLALVMPDFDARMEALAENIQRERIVIAIAVLRAE